MNVLSDPPPIRPSQRGEAFTLIELLTVISIIAVLAGLLLPVISKVMDNARKTAAKSAVTQIVTAVNNYQTDYGQYPVLATSSSGNDYTYGGSDVPHNSQLFNVLRALNTTSNAAAVADGTVALNSRRTVYFEGKNVKNTALPKDGFVQTTGGKSSGTPAITFNVGDFVDPWGTCYLVRIDTSYSNAVQNPFKDGSTSSTTTDSTSTTNDADLLHVGVAAYSYGIDGKVATNGALPPSPYTAIGDDVVSWQ